MVETGSLRTFFPPFVLQSIVIFQSVLTMEDISFEYAYLSFVYFSACTSFLSSLKNTLFFSICLSLELEKIYIDKICNIPLVSNLNLDAFPGVSEIV